MEVPVVPDDSIPVGLIDKSSRRHFQSVPGTSGRRQLSSSLTRACLPSTSNFGLNKQQHFSKKSSVSLLVLVCVPYLLFRLTLSGSRRGHQGLQTCQCVPRYQLPECAGGDHQFFSEALTDTPPTTPLLDAKTDLWVR